MQTTKTKSSQAQAATLIRKDLKAAFPSIKFGVRSRGFSMGDAVDVEWTDGPTSDQVNSIVKKYQYGHFDGMTDMYENTNSRDDIPQSKYVQVRRSYSDEARAAVKADLEKSFAIKIEDNGWVEQARCWGSDFIYRHICKIDYCENKAPVEEKFEVVLTDGVEFDERKTVTKTELEELNKNASEATGDTWTWVKSKNFMATYNHKKTVKKQINKELAALMDYILSTNFTVTELSSILNSVFSRTSKEILDKILELKR